MTDTRNEHAQHPAPSGGRDGSSLAVDTTNTLAAGIWPSRNDSVTLARGSCEVCWCAFSPAGRRRFCLDACRQAGWRRRHCAPAPLPALPDAVRQSGRSATVYECPSCGTRYLSQQRCPDCQIFCRRVGAGGRCPHCDEPVALIDLVANEGR